MSEKIKIPYNESSPIHGYLHSGGDELIIVLHGFKSFCDWGFWPYFCDAMINENTSVLRFNFTHNGVSEEDPLNFTKLDLFGKNTYSKEIDESNAVIAWAKEQNQYRKIHLLGHSRGGGMALLSASESNVDSVITLNSIDSIDRFDIATIELLKKDGVIYIPNARTQQKMPLYKDILLDAEANPERFNILDRAKTINSPCLHIHSQADTTVPMQDSINLCTATKGTFLKLEGSNHVYSCSHPFTGTSDDLEFVIREVKNFIYSQ
jgi:uncharacterized protein